jgi:two-component system, cell cycle sensor histidine kinase and response regulator CckA
MSGNLQMSIVQDPVRLAAVQETGLPDSPPEEAFDRLTRLAVRITGAPVAFVSLVEAERDFYKSFCGFGEPLATLRELSGTTFCHYAIASEGPLVIEDTRAHAVFRTVPTVESLGVAAYLGIPIRFGGQAIGSFCAIDFAPRRWSDDDVEILAELALSAQREIELRARTSALQRTATEYAAVLDQIAEGIIVTDPEGRIRFVNRASREIHGVDRTGVSPQEYAEAYRLFTLEGTPYPSGEVPLARAVLHGEVVTDAEGLIRRPDGAEVVIRGNARPIVDEQGRRVGALVSVRDITREKREGERLLLLERAIATTVEGILITDARQPDHPVVFTNPGFERLTGYTVEETIGRNCRFLQGAETDRESVERIRDAVAREEHVQAELLNYRKDGTAFWNHLSITPIRDAEGAVTHFVGIQQDVTRLRQAQAGLEAAEEHYRRLVKTSPVGIYALDTGGRCIESNLAMTWITERTSAELDGIHFSEVLAPEDHQETARAFEQMFSGQTEDLALELRILRPSGERRLAAVTVTTIREADRIVGVHGVIRDVTEARRTEAALVESERTFRQIAESIRQVFWMTDVTGTEVLYLSPAVEEVWGRPWESFIGPSTAWLDAVHEEDIQRVVEVFTPERLAAGLFDTEYRIVRPDGEVRWIHDRGFPVRDEQGEIYRITGLAEDVTAQRMLESQLRQSQKMEAVGQLAGGVAHDFNNMLMAITGHAQLMADELPQESVLQADLAEILRAAERSAGLTRQLLAFSRKQVLQPRRLDLNESVRSMEKMLRRLIGEDIQVHSQFARHLPDVFADPGQVEQVLLNLVVNARDAMPEGGRLTVGTEVVDLTPDDARASPAEARPGRYAVLWVSDTGIGMDQATQARIFEPFFTTKAVGRGTGLGLSTVYGIVKQSGGFVRVRSRLGHGSIFWVHLPLAEAEAERPDGQSAPHPTAGTETVLVVEDEVSVRTLVSRILRRAGYTVLEAESGAAAAQSTERHPGAIDLLLTDVVMPNMSGRAVADQLLQRYPGLRVLFMSGYTDHAIVDQGVLDPGTELIEKPFAPDVLLRRVRALLDRAPHS